MIGDEINAGEADVTVDVEDVQPLQKLITPELPSREEIEAHRIDHWPYRSWCRECVEGFGRERDHGHGKQKIAMISMDYAFVTPKGPIVDQGEEGWDDPNALKLLIVKDSKSSAVFAHAVVQKGKDDKRFAVDMVVRDVLWLGYPHVLLKSDNEPSVVKLLQEALGSLKVTGFRPEKSILHRMIRKPMERSSRRSSKSRVGWEFSNCVERGALRRGYRRGTPLWHG